MSPGSEAAPRGRGAADNSHITWGPTVHRGSDGAQYPALRRLRHHHLFVRRRRWSWEFDLLLDVEVEPAGPPLVEIDYRELAMTWRERELAGAE